MKIQKYIGSNKQELMEQIKDELGPSAIILSSKTISPKWYQKLFVKEQTEILAAIEENTDLLLKEPDPTLHIIKDKMENMEKLLSTTANKLNNLEVNKHKKQISDEDNNSILNVIYNHLLEQEVEEEVALFLLEGTEVLDLENDISQVIKVVYENIVNLIGEADIIKQRTQPKLPKVVFFIGPTGVGKTTSIAKITAELSLRSEKKVALITADTYRIAAIEQLRTYADILSVPIKVIYSHTELTSCISEYSDKDYIFIDTAGRSHKNTDQLTELQNMLNVIEDKKVYLVVSATTKFKDLQSIIKKYSSLYNDFSIIVTKTDETTTVGTIINLRYYTKELLSYVSTGQNVPDDIEVIDGGKYAKILLGSLGDE